MNKLWKTILENDLNSEYFLEIKKFLENRKKDNAIIYPKQEDIFNAYIDPNKINAVILGQDPYHGPNQAHGLSFSVRDGVNLPPSLKNIYKEIENQYSYKMNSKNGNLTPWVEQGVMLLNTMLTVEDGKPGSHSKIGWDKFTDKTIKELSNRYNNIVFILWGGFAKTKINLIDNKKHLILTSAHPSPLSAYNGFWNNNHFKLCNEYLKLNGKKEINWQIN